MATTKEQNEQMLNIIKILNQATIQYDKGHSIMSDKEWDDLYFKLSKIEKETNIILPGSPTNNIIFETISQLEKVEHDHQMLSLLLLIATRLCFQRHYMSLQLLLFHHDRH